MSEERGVAWALRDQGMAYEQIGKRLGRSTMAVYRELNPDHAERDRIAARRRYDREIAYWTRVFKGRGAPWTPRKKKPRHAPTPTEGREAGDGPS